MDLVERIASTIGCTKADAERAMEAVIDAITGYLKKGDEVSVAGLGIFEAKTRAGRTGRNPRTGEVVDVSAKRVPYFKPGKEMRARLNCEA